MTQSNVADRPAGAGAPGSLRRFFETDRVPLTEMPVVRAAINVFARRCAERLAEILPPAAALQLRRADVGQPGELLGNADHAVVVAGSVAGWSGPAVVRLDPRLLLAVLDAMYGGEPELPGDAPVRAPTGLEQSLAARLAVLVMDELGRALQDLCRLSFHGAGYCTQPLATLLEGAQGGYLVVRLGFEALGDAIVVAIPSVGLESVRAAEPADEDAPRVDLDPEWSAAFKRNVAAANVVLTATIRGPRMTLAEIAAMGPATMLELESGELEKVRVDAEAMALFRGRLGQSRGHYTVRIEESANALDVETES